MTSDTPSMPESGAASDDPRLREAVDSDLGDWDRHAVDRPGGHVFQSLAWARECRLLGWQTRLMKFADGFSTLSVERPWPVVGGRSAYLPRGPVPTDGSAERTARRLSAVAEWLAARGVDVVASDAEVEAATGYAAMLERAGFAAIPEIQPSRHRLSLPLGRAADEAGVFSGIAKQTRQRIRGAERSGLEIVRHDGRCGGVAGKVSGEPAAEPGEGFVGAVPALTAAALERFYSMLEATGERRHFTFGPREEYVRWWRAALRAGHLVLLEARHEQDAVAGLVLYRHGGRLSTVHSADLAERRREHPGALHLLRWRAIQLAIRESCLEMDLGGVDVEGARREPREGEPMFGLYQHKRSFGASWVELAGAHERVIRPGRYRIGRVAARLARATASDSTRRRQDGSAA